MSFTKEQVDEISALLEQHMTKTKGDILGENGRQLVINSGDRQIIERAFSRGFKDGHELSQYLEQRCTIDVGGVKITLTPELLRRLDGRRGSMPFDKFLIENITKQLEHVVGLR